MHCTAECNYCTGFTSFTPHVSANHLPPKPRPTWKHTRADIRQHVNTHSKSTRGQRMNNAEVVSERKSPPLFPSFSPSPSNKEAMLPWRQWSLGSLTANYSLPCVNQRANGSSGWCCFYHRHWDPIGCSLLFDWISDLVLGRKKYLKECHLCANLKIRLFVFSNGVKRGYLMRRKACFIGLWDII